MYVCAVQMHFAVISYLAMFRLEDVGMPAFKGIIATQPAAKMFKVRMYVYGGIT